LATTKKNEQKLPNGISANNYIKGDFTIQSNCFSNIEFPLSLLDARGKDANCNASNSSLLYFNL